MKTLHTDWFEVFTYPTTASPLGIYRVIDENGIYWGCWKVVQTWTGEITVIPHYI